MRDISGKVILITGGAGSLGRKLAIEFSALGAYLLLVDLESSSLEKVVDELAYPEDCNVYATELGSEESLGELITSVRESHPVVDVVVNNAAFVGTTNLQGWNEPLERQSMRAWKAALDVNLTAPFFLIQGLLEQLLASKSPSVINVGSIYGLLGPVMSLYEDTQMEHPAAYGVSKAGLLQATRYFSTVLAPRIRVNMISPGGIERGQDPRFIEKYVSRTPLGRMADEEDIIGTFLYLSSDMSRYVTGQNITVDGGWTAW